MNNGLIQLNNIPPSTLEFPIRVNMLRAPAPQFPNLYPTCKPCIGRITSPPRCEQIVQRTESSPGSDRHKAHVKLLRKPFPKVHVLLPYSPSSGFPFLLSKSKHSSKASHPSIHPLEFLCNLVNANFSFSLINFTLLNQAAKHALH